MHEEQELDWLQMAAGMHLPSDKSLPCSSIAATDDQDEAKTLIPEEGQVIVIDWAYGPPDGPRRGTPFRHLQRGSGEAELDSSARVRHVEGRVRRKFQGCTRGWSWRKE